MARFYVQNKFNKMVVKNGENDKIEPYSAAYLEYKRRCNLSKHTLRNIAQSLIFFLEFLLYSNVQIDEITKMKYSEQMKFFSDFLFFLLSGMDNPAGKPRNNNTCNAHVNHSLEFIEFTSLENEWLPLLVRSTKDISFRDNYGILHSKTVQSFDGLLPETKHNAPVATRSQVNELMAACKEQRDKVLIAVLYDTGVRIGEALSIHPFEDIDFDQNIIYVRYRNLLSNGASQKNAEERLTPISEETKELILLYISENTEVIDKTGFLFNLVKGKKKGEPMTINAANKLFIRLMGRIGSHITPHMIRHLFADERRQAGWTLLEIMTVLGHKKIETTENYLHVSTEEVLAASERFFENNKVVYNVHHNSQK